jgi:hypothetical protein
VVKFIYNPPYPDFMLFKEDKSIQKWGKATGYVFGYFLFTTILFFVLTLLGKIPDHWSYLHIAAITLFISIVGAGLNLYLK